MQSPSEGDHFDRLNYGDEIFPFPQTQRKAWENGAVLFGMPGSPILVDTVVIFGSYSTYTRFLVPLPGTTHIDGQGRAGLFGGINDS